MSRFPRLARYAAVGALAASALTVFSSAPAGAAAGSLVAASNGFTVTITSGNSAGDYGAVYLYPSPHTCATNDNPMTATLNWSSSNGAQAPALIALNTPTTITYGTAGGSMTPGGTVGAGSFVVCLINTQNAGNTVLQSLSVTIVNPNATTTTTPGGSSATTIAADPTDPVAPAFTG